MTVSGAFLQSPEWEKFQRSLGRRTWRVQGMLLIRHDLPFGMNYLYCPRPVWGGKGEGAREKFFQEAARIAHDQKSIFIKIDPVKPHQMLHTRWRVSEPLQPYRTLIMDLRKSVDELLASMHEKTRYNIGLAQRRGVTVRKCAGDVSEEDFENFWKMLQETGTRDGFRIHRKHHYQKLLQTRSAELSNELFLAESDGVALAAAVVNFYRPDGVATYLHGASSRTHRELMAPHLLHWRIMEDASARGFLQYDLWGIDGKRWPGLTRFKQGFGGGTIAYPASMDIVYRSVWYGIYRLNKYIRKA